MAKVLYIECNAGISGDMTLGALMDIGVPADHIKDELAKLDIHGEYDLLPEKKQMNGITGTDLKVITGEYDHKGHHEHNSFRSIREMIEESDLNDNVKSISISIFTAIAVAEANVHQKTVEDVVFHEVGAVDSIIDIVGTAIGMDFIGADKIYCSPVSDGSGFIECRHGIIPVPVPAVMEMMQDSDIPVVINEDIRTEMVTPTGFGILKGLNAEFRHQLEIKIDKTGYGFGDRNTGLFSAVRISLGKTD